MLFLSFYCVHDFYPLIYTCRNTHTERGYVISSFNTPSLIYLHICRYREWGWQIFEAFEKYTRIDTGGYSSLDDVTSITPHKRDKMETFFLGETLKYLYLLFGDSSLVPLDKFVFNTEAHPIPVEGTT